MHDENEHSLQECHIDQCEKCQQLSNERAEEEDFKTFIYETQSIFDQQ